MNYKNTNWLLEQVKQGKRLRQIADELNINIATVSRYYKIAIESLDVDLLIVFIDECVDKTQLISPKTKTYKTVVERTLFLPKTAQLRERLWYIQNQTDTPPHCKVCTSDVCWDYTLQQFRTYCSKSCCDNDAEAHNVRRRATNLKRLGVEYPAQSPGVRKKYTDTMQRRYGRDNANQQHITPESQSVLDCKDSLQRQYTQHITTFKLAEVLGVSQSLISQKLRFWGIDTNHSKSSVEEEVFEFLSTLLPQHEIQRNSRKVIAPLELDFYIPSKNLAIEINGIFWHSELSGKTRTYHSSKTQKCSNLNIQLLHIWDREWIEQQDIAKSRIRSILGLSETRIYARQCKVITLDSPTAAAFLNQHHIQGNARGSIAYGLSFNGTLIAAMTFCKTRFSKQYQYELLRFCNKINHTVVGGASKLFKKFQREHNPSSVVSYCDLRWGMGNMYGKLGFNHLHDSAPNYHYFRNGTNVLLSRHNFQKHKLADKLDTFSHELSEWVNMQNNNYNRVWDSGNGVWMYSV